MIIGEKYRFSLSDDGRLVHFFLARTGPGGPVDLTRLDITKQILASDASDEKKQEALFKLFSPSCYNLFKTEVTYRDQTD